MLIFAFFATQIAVSQNHTNSPYTRFGFGQLSDNTSGEQRAMGGVAIGARSSQRINTVNPASYSVSDSLTFMFDIGLSTLSSRFTDEAGNKNTRFTGNLDYLTMQFRLFPGVGFSMGVLPYSFAGYNFFSSDSIAMPGFGEEPKLIHYTTSFHGSGGITQFYTGISLDVLSFFQTRSSLSLGANMYYMFGNYNNSASLVFQSAEMVNSTRLNTISANNIRFRFGSQYHLPISNSSNLTVGAIFEPKTSFNAQATRTMITHVSRTDTLSRADFQLPLTLGFGAMYKLNNRWTFGADFSMQQWGDVLFFGERGTLQDSWNVAAGLEFLPNFRGRRMRDHILYRFGANVGQPYFLIGDEAPGKNFGITFGVGLPLPQTRTMLNFAFEYGRIGSSPLLREDYFKITFNLALTETWFFQRRL